MIISKIKLFYSAFTAVSISAFAMASWGCAVETLESGGGSETEYVRDEAKMTEYLSTQGFDTSDIIFGDNGTVVVEGDIRMKVDDVLTAADDETAKGYWWGGATADKSKTIYVTYSSTVLDEEWAWATIIAVTEWANKTDLDFELTNNPPRNAQVLRISSGKVSADSCTVADASWPLYGKVGAEIIVNGKYYCPGKTGCHARDINGLTPERKIAVMTHEIGHCLGFAHPNEGSHIKGTKRGNGYDTIMKASCPEIASGGLTKDDIKSYKKMYN